MGTRAAAALLDYGLMALFVVGLYMLLSYLARLAPDTTNTPTESETVVLAIGYLFLFALQWLYYVLFEALWDGQTPGKRALGIRVVQDGGYSVSFSASAVRNIARVVDMQPFLVYVVGIVSVGLSRSGKRLGDMIAGTFVVQERAVSVPAVAATAVAESESAPGSAAVTAVLSADEFDLLERFLARRNTLDAERRALLTEQMHERFAAVLPGDVGTPAGQRLRRLYDAERAARARGAAVRGTKGAAREHQAIVATGSPRWTAFAATLRDVKRRGLRSLSEKELSTFAARYREIATDLARLRTAAGGRESDAVFYVSRLVATGHNLLYRQQALTARAIAHFITQSVPRELRRSALPIGLAAACLFGPMAITYRAVVRDPALAERLLPPGMIDRATEGAARARHGDRSYVQVKDYMRPVMASRIIGNNVQVTYAVFAMGITAGVLTVIMLVFNGISIGAAFGLYATKGIFGQIGGFVLAHSVFELSAICIAGGGGLLLASALLLPGDRTRREALVVQGRRALRLITASTMLLLVAGTIEGLLSPRTDVPIGLKIGVAALCAAALVLYVALGGRSADADRIGEQFAYSDARALISR